MITPLLENATFTLIGQLLSITNQGEIMFRMLEQLAGGSEKQSLHVFCIMRCIKSRGTHKAKMMLLFTRGLNGKAFVSESSAFLLPTPVLSFDLVR